MKHVGINDEGDFDQLTLGNFAQNYWGDFDQLSLAGVDFGEDYCKDYGVTPNNLTATKYSGEGEMNMQGYHNQLGVVPAGLSGDFDQLGIVPEGMGHYNQLGTIPQGLGHSQYYQMGFLPSNLDFKTWTPTNYAVVAGIAVAALYAARQLGFIKTKLPLIG